MDFETMSTTLSHRGESETKGVIIRIIPPLAISDLDGVDLPEAWAMPETPTLAHLEKDINLLEKSGAIPKFSGELVDYIMWRAAFPGDRSLQGERASY